MVRLYPKNKQITSAWRYRGQLCGSLIVRFSGRTMTSQYLRWKIGSEYTVIFQVINFISRIHVDLEFSIYNTFRQKFWLDCYREMFKEYFPFKPGRNDYHPCSFIPIFGLQPYMGMYYRKLWTEVPLFSCIFFILSFIIIQDF